jgi:hypothetical protein
MSLDWTTMKSPEKITILTALLNAAAIDISLHDRLLESPESALAAFKEVNKNNGTEVDFPPDFRVQFVSTHTTAKETDTVLMKIPKYFPNLTAPPVNIKEHLLCTYNYWIDTQSPIPVPPTIPLPIPPPPEPPPSAQ